VRRCCRHNGAFREIRIRGTIDRRSLLMDRLIQRWKEMALSQPVSAPEKVAICGRVNRLTPHAGVVCVCLSFRTQSNIAPRSCSRLCATTGRLKSRTTHPSGFLHNDARQTARQRARLHITFVANELKRCRRPVAMNLVKFLYLPNICRTSRLRLAIRCESIP